MDLWTCERCGSKNAAEACWKCQAPRPAGAAASTPAPPTAPDPSAAPHKPAAPSWSQPIAAAAVTPAAPPPLPQVAPGALAAPPAPAAAAPAASAPVAPPPPSQPAAPPAAAAPAAAAPASVAPAAAAPAKTGSPVPTARILMVAGVLVVILVAVLLIIALNRSSSKSLVTPASIEGLPQIHGATVDALARQARENAGTDGQGMLVGVYGQDQIPSFIFVVVQSHGNDLSNFENGFIRGASQVGFSPGALSHHTVGGVQYDCGTVQVTVGVPLAFCFFNDGSATGAGLVPDSPGIQRALQLTSSGRGASESG